MSDAQAFVKFRPVSLEEFGRYAKSLTWFIGTPLQQSQDILSHIYGYADLHELQVVMSRPGAAGPFNEDLTPRQAWARTQRASEIIADRRLQVATAMHWRANQVQALWLFDTPARHRTACRRVKPLLGEEGRLFGLAPWPNPALESRTQSLFYDIGTNWPKSALAHLTLPQASKFGPELFHPRQMRSRIQAYRDLTLFLVSGSRIETPHPDIDRVVVPTWDAGFPIETIWDLDPDRLLEPDFTQWGPIYDALAHQYGVEHLNNANALAQREQFEAYLKTQDVALIARSEVLKNMQDPERFVRQAEVVRKARLAEAFLTSRPPRTYLSVMFGLPESHDLRAFGSAARIDLYLQGNDEQETWEDQFDMLVWDYVATCSVVNEEAQTSAPFGVLQGAYIMPYRGEHNVTRAHFIERMDWQSPELASLARTITSQLPGGIEAFNAPNGNNTIATVHLEVAPQYRTVSDAAEEWMVTHLSSCFDSYPESIEGLGWDCLAFEDIDPEADDGLKLYSAENFPGEMVDMGNLSLFCFARKEPTTHGKHDPGLTRTLKASLEAREARVLTYPVPAEI